MRKQPRRTDFETAGVVKPDTSKNGDKVLEAVAEERKREKHLKPLRISNTITILVPKHKCTEEYRQKYLDKYNGKTIGVPINRNGNKVNINLDELKDLVENKGFTIAQCKSRFNCCDATIRKNIRAYKARDAK